MADNSEEMRRGQDLLKQARSKRGGGGGSGFFSGIFGGKSSKDEEAAELFVKAANTFKMGKHWREAGDAFTEAAEVHGGKSSKHDAATAFVDAANCYRKVNAEKAIECLRKAIDTYTDMGRFTIAAKHHMSVAEIYEDQNQPKLAAEHYEKAGDFYRGEESNASASKCEAKVAHLAADAGDYVKAAKIFEELGKAAMENSLLKYGAKDHFFRAALCHFNIDVLNCSQALQKYTEMHPAFTDSREYKLMLRLVETANPEEPNADEFTKAVGEYDSISRLDPWATRRLNSVKKLLKADEPDLT